MQPTAAKKQTTQEELARELLDLWMHLTRGSSQQMFDVLGELGLGMTQMKTLLMLDDCLDEVSVNDLAQRLGLSLPATSRAIEGLLRRGFLSRHEDTVDRRVKRVRLTGEGQDIVRQINVARLQGIEAFTASLSGPQRTRLLAALRDLPYKDPR